MKTELIFSHEENGKKFYKVKCLENFTLFNTEVEAGTIGDFVIDEDSELRDSWLLGDTVVQGSYIEYSMLDDVRAVRDSLLRSTCIVCGNQCLIEQAEMNKVNVIHTGMDFIGESPTKRVMLNGLYITRTQMIAR